MPVRVLLVDDDEMFRRTMGREIAHMGYEVETEARAESALDRLGREAFDVIVLDIRMPDMDGVTALKEINRRGIAGEVVMMTGHGTIENAVEAMKLGAAEYLTKPCSLDVVELTLKRVRENARLRSENTRLKAELARRNAAEFILGESPAIRSVLDLIAQVGPSDSTILIYGESGVGKELVARALHHASDRSEKPFVVIDCTALQESLLESELFGHERGAYTGATQLKHGLFEVADEGTVMLDELGEVSPAIQAKLLRALETGTFRRLGGTSDISVDVRVLAATNRPLDRLAAEGDFRKDLFYRLNVVSITVPPLRQRREDIPLLARHFLANSRRGGDLAITEEAMGLLVRHDWPGNVRELEHAIERAALLCRGSSIGPADLPDDLHGTTAAAPDMTTSLRVAERDHIVHVLDSVGGRRATAAEILGISERQLYRKLRAFGLRHTDEGSP